MESTPFMTFIKLHLAWDDIELNYIYYVWYLKDKGGSDDNHMKNARLFKFHHLTSIRRAGLAQFVARSIVSRYVDGSSPTCRTEHFGSPPPSALLLGNRGPWYDHSCLCDWA